MVTGEQDEFNWEFITGPNWIISGATIGRWSGWIGDPPELGQPDRRIFISNGIHTTLAGRRGDSGGLVIANVGGGLRIAGIVVAGPLHNGVNTALISTASEIKRINIDPR